jgi:peptidyl-dipeptidase Dcp
MAQSINRVLSFLSRIEQVAMPIAQQDIGKLQEFAREQGAPESLEKWDFTYWAEKLKKHQFNLDSETLRPYFQLEKVIEGVFAVANKLYGIQFKQVNDLPSWHEQVVTWEVLDHDGSFLGLLYGDFFPRRNKRSGAWMSTYRNQGLVEGEIVRPHVSIVCNFTKPTATKPSLLDFNEVQTLFHEFGHALHALLSKVTYRSLAGPNVVWDFVELPSQIMENWTYQKEALDLFAKHFKSGDKIPSDLCRRLKESAKFNEGYATVRQLAFAYLDLAWHSGDPTRIHNVGLHEYSVLSRFALFPRVDDSNISCAFQHIFSGGYSAGYYSYKWAEVLDADAFELFQEKGIFHPETATSFRENILEKGGTVHPLDLYKSFRGREPDPDALLRRAGLLE